MNYNCTNEHIWWFTIVLANVVGKCECEFFNFFPRSTSTNKKGIWDFNPKIKSFVLLNLDVCQAYNLCCKISKERVSKSHLWMASPWKNVMLHFHPIVRLLLIRLNGGNIKWKVLKSKKLMCIHFWQQDQGV
jgi:hypothetical protein